MTWTPRRTSAVSKGSARSRPAPMPVISSSAFPLPRVRTRSRAPSTSRNCSRGAGQSTVVGGAVGVGSDEGADTGDVPPDDQGLDGLGGFIGVYRLEVGHVPHDVVVEQDSVAAEQVPGLGDDLAGAAGVVHLRD